MTTDASAARAFIVSNPPHKSVWGACTPRCRRLNRLRRHYGSATPLAPLSEMPGDPPSSKSGVATR